MYTSNAFMSPWLSTILELRARNVTKVRPVVGEIVSLMFLVALIGIWPKTNRERVPPYISANLNDIFANSSRNYVKTAFAKLILIKMENITNVQEVCLNR